ncbi:1-acyl-sn-glycerol-3-phosphate acyltransferase [Cellulomonas sp. HZM]|uniref:lysophospholipid acyltransferase family protein n=1 Tax=Cellulomonas sp. HZM TaxID=1454010 RepID=UPI0004937C07|nr:lysophospholipid acyltransferase family protein [Cellulomonas sp. HZM]
MHSPARSNRSYRNVARVLRPILLVITKRHWSGVENLPTDRGFIVAANHMSNVDPVTFAHYLWDNGFAPKILAKAPLFKVPFVGWVLAKTGQIPVHRNTVSAGESLSAGEKAIADGECVAVFPEGTLTREPDLWPMAGKTGVARLALASRAPVIPVAQWGAQDLLGRYKKLFKPIPPKNITIVAGPPVVLDDLYGRPMDNATLREATERVMTAITELLEGIRGEKAPAVRYDMRRPVPPGETRVGGDHATKPELP